MRPDPDQAVDAEHATRLGFESDVLDPCGAQVPDTQAPAGAGGVGGLRLRVDPHGRGVVVLAGDRRDDVLAAHLVDPGVDPHPSVDQGDDARAHRVELVELVVHEHDAQAALRGQIAHGVQEALDLGALQARRRLVQQQVASVAVGGDRHLEQLPGGDRVVPQPPVDVDVQAEGRRELSRLPAHPVLVEHAAAQTLVAEERVLGHGEVLQERELLVDGGDARRDGVRRALELVAAPVHADDPGVRPGGTGDHLEQRRLAGTVVPDQPDDLARRDVDRDAVQHRDARVALDDATRAQGLRGRLDRRRRHVSRPRPGRGSRRTRTP